MLSRRKRLIAAGTISLVLCVGGALFAVEAVSAQTDAAPSNAPASLLNPSAGIDPAPSGMVAVIQEPTALLQQRGADVTSLGLDGSFTPTSGIFQYFVVADAVSTYGDLQHGLPLPLPLAFAKQHPGPAQVAVHVVEFSGSSQPQRLMSMPQFTFASNPGRVELPDIAMYHGRAFRLNSASNDGLDDLEFVWVSGNRLVQVSILGADLTTRDAQGVVGLVGANRSPATLPTSTSVALPTSSLPSSVTTSTSLQSTSVSSMPAPSTTESDPSSSTIAG